MKAIRYRANGKYLKNTLFSTLNSDFIGAYHGVETDAIFNADLAAAEEAMTIASHKQDFAVAFGIPADEIECEVIAWDGDPASLPKEDEPDAHVRLPEPPEPPKERTQIERVLAALGKDAALSAATKTAIADALK